MTRSGSIDGTRVDIRAHNTGVLTVTLSGLRTESSRWYVWVKGDLQMPVDITVTEKPTTSKCYKYIGFSNASIFVLI